ncbi:hypothetical protein FHL15_005913 [Xylaria flabelliformis]|uniref:Uncharacterized protein n=1 Tax=Xylaria flabelliformis TaxID=2512241 RepID=A0A553HZF7_9PEZI|nr:hypothetical protein FHL15_005913 [Xylaria flabelliformis]
MVPTPGSDGRVGGGNSSVIVTVTDSNSYRYSASTLEREPQNNSHEYEHGIVKHTCCNGIDRHHQLYTWSRASSGALVDQCHWYGRCHTALCSTKPPEADENGNIDRGPKGGSIVRDMGIMREHVPVNRSRRLIFPAQCRQSHNGASTMAIPTGTRMLFEGNLLVQKNLIVKGGFAIIHLVRNAKTEDACAVREPPEELSQADFFIIWVYSRDFGVSKEGPELNTIVGARPFMPPMYSNNTNLNVSLGKSKCSQNIDIWSLAASLSCCAAIRSSTENHANNYKLRGRDVCRQVDKYSRSTQNELAQLISENLLHIEPESQDYPGVSRKSTLLPDGSRDVTCMTDEANGAAYIANAPYTPRTRINLYCTMAQRVATPQGTKRRHPGFSSPPGLHTNEDKNRSHPYPPPGTIAMGGLQAPQVGVAVITIDMFREY